MSYTAHRMNGVRRRRPTRQVQAVFANSPAREVPVELR